MKSKTSFFNRTLFFSMFKRFWPIFAGYLLIWIFLLPLSVADTLGREGISNAAVELSGQLLGMARGAGTILSLLVAIAVAMAAFSYLYNARSVSMMCSLPIKREGVAVTLYTSGLFWLFVCNATVFLLTLSVEALYGTVTIGALLQWLAMVSLLNIFFFGLATLCASLTGNILVLPAVYVVLNFVEFVVEYITRNLISMFVYGAAGGDGGSGFLAWLSPVAGILSKTDVQPNFTAEAQALAESGEPIVSYAAESGTVLGSYGTAPMYNAVESYSFNGWTAILIYAAVGILLAAIGILLIRHRRMETAGDVVAVRPLKPVFKYCLCAGCALVMGAGVFGLIIGTSNVNGGLEDMLILLGIMLVGAFVGYFAAEMLMNKTLRVFGPKRWIGFGAAAVAISALMLCGEFDVFGYERYVPETKEIENVSIVVNGECVILEDTENIDWARNIHKDIIANKDIHEKGSYENYNANTAADGDLFETASAWYTYSMKDGSLVKRRYSIWYPDTDDLAELNKLFNTHESIMERKALRIPVTAENISYAQVEYFDAASNLYQVIDLTPEEAAQLYESCIVPEISDHSLGRVWFITDSDYYENVYDCQIRIELNERQKQSEYNYEFFQTTLTKQSLRTLEWIKVRGIEPMTYGESREALRKLDLEYEKENGYNMPTASAVETVNADTK